MSDLIQRLYAEADLYRNEGACDIADFLDEASRRIAELEAANKALKKRTSDVNIAFARRNNERVVKANTRVKRAEAALWEVGELLEKWLSKRTNPLYTDQQADGIGACAIQLRAVLDKYHKESGNE